MRQYTQARIKLRGSGQSSNIKCSFYIELDEILGTSPCASPLGVIEGGSVDISDDEIRIFDNLLALISDLTLLLHDLHKYKVLKWLRDNAEILDPWPGNSKDLKSFEKLWLILKKGMDKQKPTNCHQL